MGDVNFCSQCQKTPVICSNYVIVCFGETRARYICGECREMIFKTKITCSDCRTEMLVSQAKTWKKQKALCVECHTEAVARDEGYANAKEKQTVESNAKRALVFFVAKEQFLTADQYETLLVCTAGKEVKRKCCDTHKNYKRKLRRAIIERLSLLSTTRDVSHKLLLSNFHTILMGMIAEENYRKVM